MRTATHPAPADTQPLLALADDLGATLVLDSPPHAGPGAHGEHHTPAAHPTATWYVADELEPTLAAALEALGFSPPFSSVDETADYVAATAADFPPLTIGGFFIARNDEHAPPGLTHLRLPVNMAFGSGEHATTTGCLLAYEALLAEGHMFDHALDFGSGSALLAIAAARLHGTPVLAVDNDPAATRIGAENAALNGVAQLVSTLTADTPANPAVQAQAPYPLIFANILLGPLLTLAGPLSKALAPGGFLIASGFTEGQALELVATYAALGLQVHAHTARAEWQTVTFAKPAEG